MEPAGPRNKRVKVEEKTTSTNEYNEEVPTWGTHSTRWARVTPLRGQERFVAQQVNAQVTHEVGMLYFEDLRADMRLNYGGRILNIEGPLNRDEDNREWVILCSEEIQ